MPCGLGGGAHIERKVYYTVGCWGPYDLTMMTLATILLKIDLASFQTFLWLFEPFHIFKVGNWQLKREDHSGSQKDKVKLITLLFTFLREQDGYETLATQATDNISFCQFNWEGVYLQYTIIVFFTSTFFLLSDFYY